MRTRAVVAASAIVLSMCACQGLKDALSAHTDSVARTVGSQDLTVTALANLLGNAKLPVPVTKTNATILANIWSDYHRLAYAAAHSDTLMDQAGAAVTPILDYQKVTIYMDSMVKRVHVDSTTEAMYNAGAGGLLAARHILFAYPDNATQQQKDSVKKVAAAIRPQITAENFPAMAKKYSKDAQTAPDSGNLGVFAKSGMVPEFSNGTAALKPGEISGSIESQYGIHIIQRLPWSQARQQYADAYTQAKMRSADSTILEGMSKAADLEVKKDAPANVREAMKDLASHEKDNTVLATYNRGGKFTTADFVMWFNVAVPPQQRQNVLDGLPPTPDSVVLNFTKSMARYPIMLRSADSAKISIPADQAATLHDQLKQLVVQTWQQLGIAPDQLKDSAKSTGEKEKLAERRVDGFIDKFLAGEAQASPPPLPLEEVLDAKYKVTLSSTALDRVVQQGEKVRAAAEAGQSNMAGPSAIPMPGGQAGSPAKPPQPQAPAGKKPPGEN